MCMKHVTICKMVTNTVNNMNGRFMTYLQINCNMIHIFPWSLLYFDWPVGLAVRDPDC